MEVKPGYKQTEAGVIPEDWQVKPLFSFTTEIGDGIHFTPNYVKSSEFYFVNGNNLVNDRISIPDSTMCVSEAEYKTLRKNLTDRTLLLSINGTIGNLAFYNGERVVLGKSAAYINVGKGVSRRFISYCFKSRYTSLFFDNELTGTTIRNLSLQSLRNTPVLMPPTIEEQRAIAGVLSDVDALIDVLNQFIAKKRDLKQAAMQQLLTGQKRLPGFHGEWEVTTLGEIASVSKGIQLHGNETNLSGNFAHLNGGITPSDYTHKSNTPANTIAISEGGNSCGYVQFMTEPYWCGGHCYSVIPNGIENRFLYHALKGQQSAIMGLRVGSGLPNVQKTGLLAFNLRYPATEAEQTAIAVMLSDMDVELAALEQRRDKTRALKQGMMQELLTGRTRLV